MIEKLLGKIDSAEYGTVSDCPFLIGLQLYFKLEGSGVGDGGKYTINISPVCEWDYSTEKQERITEQIEFINKILKDAKVRHISQLKDKPVEVILENNCFKDFRILTEVL